MKLTLRLDKAKAVTLTDADYIAAGGQATIYGQGALIYKLYSNGNAINLAKIRELMQLLPKQNIIKPENILYDAHGRPVGFTLRWIKDAVSLCKLFTNTYRNATNLTDEDVCRLIQNIREDIAYIHKNRCLIVDCNEYNILATIGSRPEPYFIDTDSYQTPSHNADAVSPAIRDPHAKVFSANTDWYAFAVLCCQLFTGVHPYRGSHPAYKKGDMAARMNDNVSIFNPKVSLPSTARPITAIPGPYRQWLEETLEKGIRTPPPDHMTPTLRPTAARTTIRNQGNGPLVLTLQASYESDILSAQYTQIGLLVQTRKKLHAWDRSYDPVRTTPHAMVTAWGDYVTHSDSGYVTLIDRRGQIYFTQIPATGIIQTAAHFFAVSRNALTQINLARTQGRILATAATSWDIHPNRQAFDTMVIQWLIGKPHLTIPYSSNGRPCMATIKAEELEGYRIIDARHSGGLVLVVGRKGNGYDQFIFRLDNDMTKTEETTRLPDTENETANITVLPKGIAVHIPEDGTMEIFHAKAGTNDRKKITDPAIRATMRLFNQGDTVLAYEGNKVYKLRTA